MYTGHWKVIIMKFYTIEEVANISGKSQKTVRRHIAANLLKSEKISNKYRINEDDLMSWIQANPNLDEHFNIKLNFDVNENSIKYQDTPMDIAITDLWHRNYWDNKNDSNGLTFVDLFAGAGGLSLGFVMAGFTPLASIEIAEAAVDTYRYNFCEQRGFKETVESRDIRDQLVKDELLAKLKNKSVDVICGGFPCQGFSLSGNRVVYDERNSLYKDMLEIVKDVRPKFVVMENVVGLRSMLDGKIEQMIINDYANAGYKISVKVLNSADYGVPQQRKRVIFIGNRLNGTNYHPQPILSPEEYKTTKDAIEDLMYKAEDKKFNHVITKHSEEMKERLAKVEEGKSLYDNYSDSWKKCPWNQPSCTVKENHGAVNIHPKLPRVITAREMARLQSFPDNFIFKGAKKWQLVQIGNAVPPLLGKAIALSVEKSLLECVNNIDEN